MAKLTMTRRTFAKVAAATAAAAGLASATVGTALAETDAGAREGQRGQAHPFRLPRLRQDGMRCVGDGAGRSRHQERGRRERLPVGGQPLRQGPGVAAGGLPPRPAPLSAEAHHPEGRRPPVAAHQLGRGLQDHGGRHPCQPGQVRQGDLHLHGRHVAYSDPWPPTAPSSSCSAAPTAFRPMEICKGPRFYATAIDASNAYSWMEVVGRPRVFVQWGGASELSNYDDSCRTTVDVATRADKHIIVGPRARRTSARRRTSG